MITVYNMDVRKALKMLPYESIDMQITSPPYWGLRDYGKDVEVIWDEKKEGCEHEWNSQTYTIGNKSGNRDKSLWFDGKPRNNIRESNNARTQTTNFCSKCNAWKDQLGLEPNFDLYIKHLLDIFDEVKRVLKEDGTCWINLGDTYGGSNQGYGQKKGQGSGIQNAVDGYFASSNNKPPMAKIMPKCLICIPERFMIGMIERGWILRNKIIWHKPNHMPSSVKDRFTCSWEYLFFFSKSKKYYFNLDAVREPYKAESINRINAGFSENSAFDYKRRLAKQGRINFSNFSDLKKKGIDCPTHKKDNPHFANPLGGNPDDVIKTIGRTSLEQGQCWKKGGFKSWIDKKGEQGLDHRKIKQYAFIGDSYSDAGDFWDITTQPFKDTHFAVFPEKLVERPIKTTRKDAVILDIFTGSGTTLKVARDLGRDSIGIEIKPQYCEIIKRRLFKGNEPLFNEFKIIK